jgi:membrane protease YdiL (CAAX protease family)
VAGPADDEDDRPGDDEEAPSSEGVEDSFATASDVHVVVPSPHRDTSGSSFGVPLALTAIVAAGFHFSLAPGRPRWAILAALGGIYGVFSVLTVLRFRKKRELEVLKPRSGDITIASLVAGLLYLAGYVGSITIMAPGTPREGWLLHVYVMLGDALGREPRFLSLLILLIGALEEMSWRGIALDAMEARMGRRNAALATSALWALAHAPTLYRLADPATGVNPLLVAGAFGCGLVWSVLRYRTERLAPAVISHAIFSWAIVAFPLLHR